MKNKKYETKVIDFYELEDYQKDGWICAGMANSVEKLGDLHWEIPIKRELKKEIEPLGISNSIPFTGLDSASLDLIFGGKPKDPCETAKSIHIIEHGKSNVQQQMKDLIKKQSKKKFNINETEVNQLDFILESCGYLRKAQYERNKFNSDEETHQQIMNLSAQISRLAGIMKRQIK